MARLTVRTLQRLAAETGYRLDTLEKVLRLLDLLDEIAQNPVLSQGFALKGGTALNVVHLDLDRLSVDIDLNYVGTLDLAAMDRERPEVDAAIDRLFASHGYGVRRPGRVEPNQVLGVTPRSWSASRRPPPPARGLPDRGLPRLRADLPAPAHPYRLRWRG